jgi:hypothetical protein
MCKHLKKGCSNMPSRRRQVTRLTFGMRKAGRRKRSKAGEEEEKETEDEDEDKDKDKDKATTARMKRPRSRSVTRSKTRAKKVKAVKELGGSRERSQQRPPYPKPAYREENGLDRNGGSQAPKKKGKGKAKATRGDEDEDMELDDLPFPMKMEGGDGLEWQTSEYLAVLPFFHSL